jgi:TPP-dependent trihydroxycyclohexane-1,2-dione (THcHDO) dehydratase
MTVRLTVAQATVRFPAALYSGRDGVRQRLIPGCFGIGPAATNMVTGAVLATVSRIPVLLLLSDFFATKRAQHQTCNSQKGGYYGCVLSHIG